MNEQRANLDEIRGFYARLDAVMGPATTSSLRERWLSPGK
jgi:hypothetical protein